MGWASGLQAGIRLGETIRQGQLENALAEEAKKYRVTEGATGDMSSNIEQLRGLQQQNPEQAAQYEPAIAELQRRQGLTAPDYSVSGTGRDYATMEEAQRGVSQARTQGLADVYRSQGYIDKASELESRAQQQQLAGLQLSKAQREDTAENRYAQFSDYASQNPDLTAAQLKEAATKQFKLNTGQIEKYVTQRLNIDKADYDAFKVNVQKKVQGKNLSQLGALYNADPDFDDKTDLAIVPGKNGAVTLNFIDKTTGKITGTQSFKNEALATEYLVKQAVEPETLGSWLLGVQGKEQQIKASEASVRASDASVGLSNARVKSLKNLDDREAQLDDIRSQYAALSDADKAGPIGVGLARQFNMISAAAGKVIPTGSSGAVGKTMTDLEKENLRYYRDWEKDDRNTRLPQAEKDRKARELGIYELVNPGTAKVESGLGSNPYAR